MPLILGLLTAIADSIAFIFVLLSLLILVGIALAFWSSLSALGQLVVIAITSSILVGLLAWLVFRLFCIAYETLTNQKAPSDFTSLFVVFALVLTNVYVFYSTFSPTTQLVLSTLLVSLSAGIGAFLLFQLFRLAYRLITGKVCPWR